MVTQSQVDDLYRYIRELEARIKRLENNTAPTIPIYDQTNFPQDAVEGQIAIAPI